MYVTIALAYLDPTLRYLPETSFTSAEHQVLWLRLLHSKRAGHICTITRLAGERQRLFTGCWKTCVHGIPWHLLFLGWLKRTSWCRILVWSFRGRPIPPYFRINHWLWTFRHIRLSQSDISAENWVHDTYQCMYLVPYCLLVEYGYKCSSICSDFLIQCGYKATDANICPKSRHLCP